MALARVRSRSGSLRLLRRAFAASGSSATFTRCQRRTPPSSPSSSAGTSEGTEAGPQSFALSCRRPGGPACFPGEVGQGRGRRGPQGKRDVEDRVAAQGLARPSTPRPWSSPTRTHCRPRPPRAPGSAWSCGFPAGEVWGDPDTADGMTRTPACPPRTRGQVGAAGPRDSLCPEGQLGAGLWETAPPLCSWGMSLTVAPSGTWRGGEQRLGSLPG